MLQKFITLFQHAHKAVLTATEPDRLRVLAAWVVLPFFAIQSLAWGLGVGMVLVILLYGIWYIFSATVILVVLREEKIIPEKLTEELKILLPLASRIILTKLGIIIGCSLLIVTAPLIYLSLLFLEYPFILEKENLQESVKKSIDKLYFQEAPLVIFCSLCWGIILWIFIERPEGFLAFMLTSLLAVGIFILHQSTLFRYYITK